MRVDHCGNGRRDHLLVMTGVVTRIEAKTFWFKGRIAITDNEITGVCIREGTYTFRIIGARKLWRMRNKKPAAPAVPT